MLNTFWSCRYLIIVLESHSFVDSIESCLRLASQIHLHRAWYRSRYVFSCLICLSKSHDLEKNRENCQNESAFTFSLFKHFSETGHLDKYCNKLSKTMYSSKWRCWTIISSNDYWTCYSYPIRDFGPWLLSDCALHRGWRLLTVKWRMNCSAVTLHWCQYTCFQCSPKKQQLVNFDH